MFADIISFLIGSTKAPYVSYHSVVVVWLVHGLEISPHFVSGNSSANVDHLCIENILSYKPLCIVVIECPIFCAPGIYGRVGTLDLSIDVFIDTAHPQHVGHSCLPKKPFPHNPTDQEFQ
jgi:hypothetical protein